MEKGKDKKIEDKLRNFQKSVSVPILKAASDEEGFIDTALLITGMAMTMDCVMGAVSKETSIPKAFYIRELVTILIGHLKDKE